MTKLCECNCGEATPIAAKTDRRKGHVKGEPMRFIPGHYGRTLRKGNAVQRCTDPADKEITEGDIVVLRKVDDVQAADIYDARLIALERGAKRSFIEMGMICLEVTKRELWRRIVAPDWIDAQGREHHNEYFRSVDAWIADRLGVSRTSAYNAMKVLETSVSVDDLREMPRRNAVRLSRLSTKVQKDPKIIAAAKGSEKGFVEVIQKRHPDQHEEPRRAVMATLEDSSRSAMDACFEVVRWAYDVETRQDVLENLFAYFMDGKCEREGFTNWTNREAFEAATKRGVA